VEPKKRGVHDEETDEFVIAAPAVLRPIPSYIIDGYNILTTFVKSSDAGMKASLALFNVRDASVGGGGGGNGHWPHINGDTNFNFFNYPR
jgi:hypothetical protein